MGWLSTSINGGLIFDAGALPAKSECKTTQHQSVHFEVTLNLRREYQEKT
jgi:hypothetical protein